VVASNLSTEKPLEGIPKVSKSMVEWLDRLVEKYEGEMPPIERFIFAGGTRQAAFLHLARTVARRAEREVVALAEKSYVDPVIIAYLNRLSTLLFALARLANYRAGVKDDEWTGRRT